MNLKSLVIFIITIRDSIFPNMIKIRMFQSGAPRIIRRFYWHPQEKDVLLNENKQNQNQNQNQNHIDFLVNQNKHTQKQIEFLLVENKRMREEIESVNNQAHFILNTISKMNDTTGRIIDVVVFLSVSVVFFVAIK